MKKIMIFFLVTLQLLYSDALNNNIVGDQIRQREIKTLEDYRELESLLKKIIAMGDYTKSVILGTLYMNEFKLKDKIIKPDLKKAKYYLNQAYLHNINIAAFYLSFLLEKDMSLIVLENAIQKEKDIAIKNQLAIRYNELVLNDFFNDKSYVKNALRVTLPVFEKSKSHILEFSIAHLYYILNDFKKANLHLNNSCNSDDIPDILKNLCFNSPYINKKPKDTK